MKAKPTGYMKAKPGGYMKAKPAGYMKVADRAAAVTQSHETRA